MSDNKMRESAEQAYTMTAHDYCSNPVGSRDWTLFWRGYQAALAEQPAQDADRLRAERDHARAQYNNAIKRIVGIHSLLYPAPVTAADGRRFVFRPKGFDPHEILQELSDRIRALSDALPEQQPAPSVPDELLIAAYLAGNRHGHETTVEGYWNDDPRENAEEWVAEQPKSAPSVPSAWMTDHKSVCGDGITRDASIATAWKLEGWRVTPLYAAPQPPEHTTTGATPYTGGRAARPDIDPAEGVPVPEVKP